MKVYGLAALFAALAAVSVIYPVMWPTPTADQMIEVQGTVRSVLVAGSGSSRKADFVIDGQSLLFWTHRGYGHLAKGCEVRFFVRAEHGQIKQAYDGSVQAWALEDDGERVDTLQEELRRERIYQALMVLLGVLLGALAIFIFRMDPRDWKDGPQPEVHVPPPAAPSNKSAA